MNMRVLANRFFLLLLRSWGLLLLLLLAAPPLPAAESATTTTPTAAIPATPPEHPCVDVTSTEYGFPFTVECPFSVDKPLLDEAVKLAKQAASTRKIVSGRFGHLSHPLWNPGASFVLEAERSGTQYIDRLVQVYFGKRKETRQPGKASCGRDLVVISAATLNGGDPMEWRREIFTLGKTEVAASLTCRAAQTIRPAAGEEAVKARALATSLLQALQAGTHLRYGEPGEIKSLVGRVHPQARVLIPEAIREAVFAPLKGGDGKDAPSAEETERDDLQDSGVVEMPSLGPYTSKLLRKGRAWTEADLTIITGIECAPGEGRVELGWPAGKYRGARRTFFQVDSVWIMSASEGCVCY